MPAKKVSRRGVVDVRVPKQGGVVVYQVKRGSASSPTYRAARVVPRDVATR